MPKPATSYTRIALSMAAAYPAPFEIRMGPLHSIPRVRAGEGKWVGVTLRLATKQVTK